MSNSKAPKESWKESVKNTRIRSYCNMENNFSNRKECIAEHYDLTTYTDASGNVWYPYLFGKTLEHNTETGFISKEHGDKLINAIASGTLTDINNITLFDSMQRTRKLEGLTTLHSYNLTGNDPVMHDLPTEAEFAIDSSKNCFEMLEVYAKSLARDINFSEYAQDASNLVTALNQFDSDSITAPKNGVNQIDASTLFRGKGQDELYGPYISQFLLLPFNYGNLSIDQKYKVEKDSYTGLTMSSWLDVQNGVQGNNSMFETSYNYVNNGRVLGSKVHMDPLFQFYYNACLIAMQNNISPSAWDNDITTAWTDAGPPCLLAAVSDVALGALRVAWYQKFGLTMKIRPEVLAQRITLGKNNSTMKMNVSKLNTIVECISGNEIMNLVHNKNNMILSNNSIVSDFSFNYLLNVQFAEGSPTHPSLPAGHAVVAGACVTVLKAMLETHDSNYMKYKWSDTSVMRDTKHSINGMDLVDYTGSDAADMTIVGELNKLASNVSLGRDFAGVHYRCDGDCGIKTGEDYAISYLVDKALELHASKNSAFTGWILEKMDGTIISITENGVTTISV